MFTEGDWKYISRLHAVLLEEFSRRLNREVAELLRRTDITEDEKRHLIYKHVRARDRDVADCFNDWKRSNLPITALFLRKHGLLAEHHLRDLSPEAASFLREKYPGGKSGVALE
jgi:hypothetical protein